MPGGFGDYLIVADDMLSACRRSMSYMLSGGIGRRIVQVEKEQQQGLNRRLVYN